METGFRSVSADFSGFVRAQGDRLCDASGKELLLRGIGLGNWFLPEGYMWRFPTDVESPRQIEQLVTQLLGNEAAAKFWHDFKDSFISEADIALIASFGFDHIRLPINSRVVFSEDGLPVEEGLVLIDRVIEWCRKHGLWVLLDLHGAPGGQTGTNIDDSPRNKPELFLDRRNWNLTIELWRVLAKRYKDETVILGYDLLNEPLPNDWQYIFSAELATLYKELTKAIREIDTEHLIVYEGSHWATNWDIFTEVWDRNSMLQFHKYWSPPDKASIQKFLDTRQTLGLPIYMGEGGENNEEWLYTAFRLYESMNIGWNFWPWKKMDTITSPLSVDPPSEWELVQEFARGKGSLDQEKAQTIFDELLQNMRTENAQERFSIVRALLGLEPRVIPAWGFGFRGMDESYHFKNGAPLSDFRASDLVTLERRISSPEIAGNSFDQNDGRSYSHEEEIVVSFGPGDWLEYEVDPDTNIDAYVFQVSEGNPESLVTSRTRRGFRVQATEAVKLLRIRTAGS